ncbi:hypothetical protein NUM3379_10500 [Kineococcus sp. NUM-3379]
MRNAGDDVAGDDVAGDGRGAAPMRLPDGEPEAGPWQVHALTDLAAWLLAVVGEPAGRPAVVAVDGRSANGKSTFAARLAAAVPGSTVVHTDDIAWYVSFFGWEDLLVDGVLVPVHRGEAVAFRPPAWDERARPGAIEVPAGARLLLVEGVGSGRRAFSPWLDAVVWVQSDRPEAERRGIERDGGDVGFWEEWEAEERPFLAADRPWERAVLTVCGTPVLPHDPGHEVVVAPGSAPGLGWPGRASGEGSGEGPGGEPR